MFAEKCVAGIEADEARCRDYAERSSALATALNPIIGYAKAAELVHRAVDERRSIIDLAIEEGHLDAEEARRVLDPLRLTGRAVICAVEGVEQAAGAEAERLRRGPAGADDLVGQLEVGAGVGEGADATRRLEADGPAGHLDRLEHDLGRLRRRRHRRLAGGRLDEVGAVGDGEVRRPVDGGPIGQLAGLDDHLHRQRPGFAAHRVEHLDGVIDRRRRATPCTAARRRSRRRRQQWLRR